MHTISIFCEDSEALDWKELKNTPQVYILIERNDKNSTGILLTSSHQNFSSTAFFAIPYHISCENSNSKINEVLKKSHLKGVGKTWCSCWSHKNVLKYSESQGTSQQSQMYQIVQFAIKRGLEKKPDFSRFLIGQSWTRVSRAKDIINKNLREAKQGNTKNVNAMS